MSEPAGVEIDLSELIESMANALGWTVARWVGGALITGFALGVAACLVVR